jgi:hypothetical protein
LFYRATASLQGRSERGIRHIGAITKDVSLIPAKFRVEVVFVTETAGGTATTHIIVRHDEAGAGLSTAAAVKRNACTHVHVKREIAGERFQERLVQHWSWSLACCLCTIRIGQDACVQYGTVAHIRFERLHLGLHGLDALLVLSLHLIHLRLERIHITLTCALSEKRVSGQ